jgi:hypothetical protein
LTRWAQRTTLDARLSAIPGVALPHEKDPLRRVFVIRASFANRVRHVRISERANPGRARPVFGAVGVVFSVSRKPVVRMARIRQSNRGGLAMAQERDTWWRRFF